MQQIKLADYQNSLRELGCSAELTDTVMQLLRSGDTQNAALLLRRHKHLLLAELPAGVRVQCRTDRYCYAAAAKRRYSKRSPAAAPP